MVKNKSETIERINIIKGMRGWIVNYPTKFHWRVDNYKKPKHFNTEKHRKNLIHVEAITGWNYVSYPPHSRHYNFKDLIKNIK